MDDPPPVAVRLALMGGDPDETLPAPGSGGGAVVGGTLAIGALVAGRYRVMRRVGEGGMGRSTPSTI